MRQSQILLNTLRERPSEADTEGHGLLLRGGYIRQLAAGIYSYLPLGRRVLRKIEGIVREEMERAGVQEVMMPSMQPAELWMESGRYGSYGKNLMTVNDRHGREFILGPTHEEAVTSLMKNEVSSYRKLPVKVYQIGTKFRDEKRPRFGLLRGREFIMKDAYSFDISEEGLDLSYQTMFGAYNRIFARCGLRFKAVEADAGTIGGDGGSHEFIALSAIGEDTVAVCGHCDYAANLEQAETAAWKGESNGSGGDEGNGLNTPQVDRDQPVAVDTPFPEKFHTPDIRTIDQLTAAYSLKPEQIIKTLIYRVGGDSVAVLVRGDHEVNELKVGKYLGAEDISLADGSEVETAAGVISGYVGPVGLELPLLVDYAVAEMMDGIAGAGERDYHFRGVRPGRDFPLTRVGDFRNAAEGDSCPRCREGRLTLHRGIEIGHVFKLGTRYSGKLGVVFLDASGRERNMIMGCYGIGISRLLAAVAEQNAGEGGIAWPDALAPFKVQIIIVSIKDEAQIALAEKLYGTLKELGLEVLLDDRDERPGVKFNDSGLIGTPQVVVVGREAALERVEYENRHSGVKETLGLDEAVLRITEHVKNSRI
ncbi:prolyl-tRNA synthetase [Paenibacillus sophorae]|uniref:Proline--tRNA ligase n=1 Tax=Paenibacillus sophorae TaxID=1333845 RepID=A0A1H8FWX0_9BACL|nr:proline--tRNA ligase [Paenibacillus sophorae]QWU14013.1 proline--tRNA ligase [Paenibacillus sophorae]SEN36321.1 prolyl-tRNA synthetase [Paenibacillus sophorae]